MKTKRVLGYQFAIYFRGSAPYVPKRLTDCGFPPGPKWRTWCRCGGCNLRREKAREDRVFLRLINASTCTVAPPVEKNGKRLTPRRAVGRVSA